MINQLLVKEKITEDIYYLDQWNFLEKKQDLFNQIYLNSKWQEEYIKIFGRKIKCPRKIAYYGNDHVCYKYSGNIHQAEKFYPLLLEIKNELEHYTGENFNFVLLNYYKDGQDYMGFHSDDEKELGENPFIASISLGASRLIKFKHKKDKLIHKLVLNHNSLLIMKGKSQQEWLHSIPKTSANVGARINMTFRLINNI